MNEIDFIILDVMKWFGFFMFLCGATMFVKFMIDIVKDWLQSEDK